MIYGETVYSIRSMSMSEMKGFRYEFYKEALKLPGYKTIKSFARKAGAHTSKFPKKQTYTKTFTEGAKGSVPWLLGFGALEQASKSPHISLDKPKEKQKRLVKNIATGAAGWGAWDVANRAIGSRKRAGIGTVFRMANRGKGSKGLKLLPKVLKRWPRAAAALGGGIAAGSAAEALLSKIIKTKPSVEIPLNQRRRNK